MTSKKLKSVLGNSLPAGMSKADVEAVLQFLYGAFDKRSAKQVQISHPYIEENAPQVSVSDFCRWLQFVCNS
ncbi:hypothetical protein KDK_08030 [Dictyobacter kobayashii]|uniref:Uncharacterized protein n=1 Tax=Dictyobacter kobayashii TaxID=2014872 RepID=A0A402AD42_9CHLR|nr:hypothetical protein KDK_08030 [Dictyobacter kobayashii]